MEKTKPLKFGKGLSSRLYRLTKWLWSKQARSDSKKIIQHIKDKELINGDLSQEIETLEKILQRSLTDVEFKKLRKGIIDLENIKKNYPEIFLQLTSIGDHIFPKLEFDTFVFSGLPRGWKFTKDMALSITFFAPELHRVVSYETSEQITRINEFKKMHLENIQFYKDFNRIKGVNQRKMIGLEEIISMDDFEFLFRSVSDLKMIHKSKVLQHYSSVSTESMEADSFLMATHFVMFGRVNEFEWLGAKQPELSDVMKSTLFDHTGSFDFHIRDDVFNSSSKEPLNKLVRDFFNIPNNISKKRLEIDYTGYVFLIGYWPVDDTPYVLKIVPLGNEVNLSYQQNFYCNAYMNMRKKVNNEMLKKMFHNRILESNKSLYAKGVWMYQINPEWDIKEFERIIQKNRSELDVLAKGPSQYLAINEFHHKLYISENPQKEFAEIYNLSHDNMCLKCGRELYKFGDFTIQYDIQNNDGNVSMEYQSLFSFNEDSMEVLNVIKYDLKEINSTKNIKNAEIFVKQFLNDKRVIFGNKNDLDICKIVYDIFNSIKELKQRRILFQFSKNPEIISILLKLENPKMIHVGDPSVIDLSLGKNCIVHGRVVQKSSEDRGKISFIFESYAVKDFEEKKSEKINSLSLNIKNYCTRWHNLVDDSIVNNKQISNQEIIEFKKQWIDIYNQLNDELFITSEGIRLDLSPIKQLTFEENLFYIFCHIVQKNELRSLQNWKNILDKMYECRRMQKSESARQTGNISDMNLLLRAIALRFYNFHYQNTIGNKQHFGSDVLYNSLRNDLERITFSDKKNSNRFTYLGSVPFQTHKFMIMCKMLLTGEIKDSKQADRFLGNYSWRDEGRKFNRMQQRKPFVNQKRIDPKQSTYSPSHSKIQNQPNKQLIRKEQTHLDPVLEIKLEKIGFQNNLEELSREWKRVSDAKSQTHVPKIYHELKNIFQPKLQFFINHYCKTCPEISSLRGKSIESKEIKNFFRVLSQKREFSQEAITKMMSELK